MVTRIKLGDAQWVSRGPPHDEAMFRACLTGLSPEEASALYDELEIITLGPPIQRAELARIIECALAAAQR